MRLLRVRYARSNRYARSTEHCNLYSKLACTCVKTQLTDRFSQCLSTETKANSHMHACMPHSLEYFRILTSLRFHFNFIMYELSSADPSKACDISNDWDKDDMTCNYGDGEPSLWEKHRTIPGVSTRRLGVQEVCRTHRKSTDMPCGSTPRKSAM